jgi:hypothetical protein
MKIDEAIKHAEEVANLCEYEASRYDMTDSYESHVACQEGKCAEEHRQLANWLKELKQLREQKPCEDAISRQAMLDYQQYLYGNMSNEENYELWKFIKALPSVTSKTEPYEDAVSRKAIEKLKRWRFSYDTDTTVPKSDLFVKLTDLRDLPPVAPAHKFTECKQENVLEKIRAEIEELEYLNIEDGSDGHDKYIEQYEVLQILNKYKAEMENND